MGQTNMQKLQDSLIQLVQSQQIEPEQAEAMLKDYIASGQQIKDIHYFMQDKSVDLFLKYFIKYTYSQQGDSQGPGKIGCKSVKAIKMGKSKISTKDKEKQKERQRQKQKEKQKQKDQQNARTILRNAQQQIKQKWNYFLTQLQTIYTSGNKQITTIRQKIKDMIISQLQVQSYRYYYYNDSTMRETNSKILYFYQSSSQQLQQYAKSALTAHRQKRQQKQNNNRDQIYNGSSQVQKINLDKIFNEMFPISQYFCYESYNKVDDSLHILVVEVNSDIQKWKYGKAFLNKYQNQKQGKRQIQSIIGDIFAVLIQGNGLKNLYDSQCVQKQPTEDFLMKNIFIKFVINFIEHLLHLQQQRVKHLLSQCHSSIPLDQNHFICLIQKKLSKIRSYKCQTISQSKILYLDFNFKKQLKFIYTNNANYKSKNLDWNEIIDVIPQQLKNKNNDNDIYRCLWHFLQGRNKKSVKKVLDLFEKCTENQTVDINQEAVAYINKNIDDPQSNGVSIIFQMSSRNQPDNHSELSLDKNSQIIRRLKNQHPNVTESGWFKQFIKQQYQNMMIGNDLSSKNNRKNMIKLPKLNKSYNIENFQSSYSISDLQEDIQIDCQSVNLLQFSEGKLEIFTIKLLSKLPYFYNLPHERDQFPNFLRQMHYQYEKNENKFHNFTHAVNVLHTCYLFTRAKKNSDLLSDFDKFIIILSGLCHDVGHTGFTNLFQIARESPLALTYNNRSPLQNYHASRTFELLRKPENNFLSSLNQKQFNYLRQLMISSILYTDIKQHFNLLKKFESRKQALSSTLNQNLKSEDVNLLAGMIIHASDFGGSVKVFQICKTWSILVNQEFSKQYEQQGRLGLPQTPFMKDLDKMGVLAKNQSGFLKVIVHPLFKEIDGFYDDKLLNILLRNVENNIKQWQKIYQEEQSKKSIKSSK